MEHSQDVKVVAWHPKEEVSVCDRLHLVTASHARNMYALRSTFSGARTRAVPRTRG